MVLTFKSTIMSQPFFLRVLVDKAKVFKVISYFQLFHKTLYKRYLKTPKVWKKKNVLNTTNFLMWHSQFMISSDEKPTKEKKGVNPIW